MDINPPKMPSNVCKQNKKDPKTKVNKKDPKTKVTINPKPINGMGTANKIHS